MSLSQYEYVKNFMDGFLHTVTYDPEIQTPSIAYTQTYNIRDSEKVINIFVNDTDKELAEYLYIHECGHVLLGHMHNIEEKMNENLIKQIEASYKKVVDLFGNSYIYKDLFTGLLFNITMDFEVNSRFFTPEEFFAMNRKIQIMTCDPKAQGMWPADYGLPLGLTWYQYLTYILLDPRKYLQMLRMDTMAKQMMAKRAQDAAKKHEDFNGVLSQEEYRKIHEEAKKRLSRGERLELKSRLSAHSEKEYGIPTGTMEFKDTADNFSTKPCKVNITSYMSMDELVNKLQKMLSAKKRNNNLRNQMYNTNRNKYNSSVIIPKNVHNESRKIPDLYLLIDVSGSVSPETIHNFVQTFSNFKKDFRKTQIVFWDTDYVDEMTLDDPIPDMYGGGNNIAKGITYMNETYKLQPRDAFFVISDFMDDLHAWEKSLKPIKCRKLAIDWCDIPLNSNYGFDDILMYQNTSG